jgi:spore maturation protein CgeB
VLLFGNVFQPPYVNNLIGPVRAFERECAVRVVEPRLVEGFVTTGGFAPAPVPETVADLVEHLDPEVVVCLGGALFVPDELKRRLPASAIYVGIALSDPQGLPSSLAIAPHFDLFYSHDPSCFPAYEAAGIRVRECAHAADAELFAPMASTREWDVFFAGKWTPYRQEAVRALSRACRVRLHGYAGETRWDPPAGPVLATPEALREGITSAKLCLDFAVIDDFPPPIRGTWRITPRPHIAAACGAPSLVEENPLLHRYFKPGEEIVPFASIPDLVERTKELIAEPKRCAEIGRRARSRVLREHLWGHRVAAILSDVRHRADAVGRPS